jgi:hypothetical protein
MVTPRKWTPDIVPVKLEARDDYSLYIEFNDKTQVVYDASELVQEGVFQKLQNIKRFKSAKIAYGTVIWDDTLDLAPEAIYEDSQLLADTVS